MGKGNAVWEVGTSCYDVTARVAAGGTDCADGVNRVQRCAAKRRGRRSAPSLPKTGGAHGVTRPTSALRVPRLSAAIIPRMAGVAALEGFAAAYYCLGHE